VLRIHWGAWVAVPELRWALMGTVFLFLLALRCGHVVAQTAPQVGHMRMAGAPHVLVLTSTRAEGAPFLLLPVGGRGVGMGRAMTAVSGPEAPFWNPAGLAGTPGRRVLIARGEHITGEALTLSLQGVGLYDLRGALTVQLLDEGSQDATDLDGNVVGSLTNRSHIAMVTLAREWGNRLHLGASAKYLQFTLGCRGQCPQGRVRASAYAIDVGARAQPVERLPWHLGIALVHLGSDFRNRDAMEGDPLPTRIRIGIAGTPWETTVEGERIALLVSMDAEDRTFDRGEHSFLFGVEFVAGSTDQLFVRGGYSTGRSPGLEGASVGFGFRFDRFELDLARGLPRGAIASKQEPTHLTLAVRLP